ncbi:MAG: hypothetical protein RIB60_06070 [Phycisphaerales bacterium]
MPMQHKQGVCKPDPVEEASLALARGIAAQQERFLSSLPPELRSKVRWGPMEIETVEHEGGWTIRATIKPVLPAFINMRGGG